jgi:diguanylate cyclase (GGDEF)-like protein
MSPDLAMPLLPSLDDTLTLPRHRREKRKPDAMPQGGDLDRYRLMLESALDRVAEAEQTINAQRERIEYLETLSLTDELTGLMNRRGFQAAFRRELGAARRSGVGGMLVMVDLDGFKAINDTHGHLAGDAYLRRVAHVLRDGIRAQDVLCRLGGDEFAILLTGADEETGKLRADELAAAVNSEICPWRGAFLPLRASFGTHHYGAEDREELAMRRADAAMYATKSGRKEAA